MPFAPQVGLRDVNRKTGRGPASTRSTTATFALVTCHSPCENSHVRVVLGAMSLRDICGTRGWSPDVYDLGGSRKTPRACGGSANGNRQVTRHPAGPLPLGIMDVCGQVNG